MKKTKITKRKIITISSIVIALGAIIFVSLFFVFSSINKKPSSDRVLVDYKSYNGQQAYITTSNAPTAAESSISISDVKASATSDYTNYTITISTAEELYKFSEFCYNDSKFLGYKYELLCNIDFDDYKNNDFIPIGCNGTSFSGSFNGNGYEIRNLELINLTSANVNAYSNMTYFAMFSEVSSSGIVTDFGLVDPIITIAALSEKIINNGGVSYVVGSNAGYINYVFVRCLSTTLLDECGITAAGGYRISGLCVNNSGTISDSYIATNSIYNYTLTDVVEFADIALTNTGSISNCYFYNTSIDSSSTQTENGYNLIFTSDLGGITKSGSVYYGIMVKSLTELNEKFKEKEWTVKTNSDDENKEISDYYSNETPIHRGFTYPVSFSFDNDSYTITISNVKDFLFMFELMNGNNYFASSAINYLLVSDLNLAGVPAKTYSYKSSFGSIFTGEKDVEGNVTLVNGSKKNHTIYNVDITNPERKHTVSGVDAYGLFPYLIGSVSYINIVTDANLDNITESNNVKSIGGVCGYSEGGVIDNVNVMLNATLSSKTKIGEYYLGGITGILGGEGGITNSTTTGNFDLEKNENYTANTSYMGGIAVGGVVGYIEDSLGYVNTCLSATNITIGLGSSTATYAVGGVIGAGYIKANDSVKTEKLENLGKILISDVTKATTATQTNTYNSTIYNILYAAGVIGRLLGQTEQVQMLVNQGNIELYGNTGDNKLTMLAGVLNADVRSQAVANTNISQSLFKDKNGNTLFYASSLTNRADINVLSATSNLVYTSVLNIVSSNGIKSSVSNIYNLNNNNVYSDTARKTKKLDDFEIDISNAYTYAACLNVVGSTDIYDVNVETIYNLRNINYKNTKATESTNILKYSAVALGDNVTIKSGKNEGNITFNFTNNVTANIMSVGIIDNVGVSSTLYDVYNGGNMTLDSNVLITGNLYFSGICYSNIHKYSDLELNKFNPLSTSYDTSAVGAIDNVINKGDILITNSEYSKITYTAKAILGGDAKNTIAGTEYDEQNAPTYNIVGSINATGITYLNESVINNTFNLGNIGIYNHATSDDSKNEINASGVSNLNVGSQSYILNSANNGIIKGINLSKNTIKVNSSGISIRNDKNADGTNYNGNKVANHSKQMISFTINYGSVFAYSNGSNIKSSTDEPSSKASGVLTMGLCNLINSVNYGNIYGSESAAGIFGVVYFKNFEQEVTPSNKVNIANSINYGNVYQLEKGTNLYKDNTSFIPSYDDFLSLTDSNVNGEKEKTFTKVPVSMNQTDIKYDDITGKAYFAKKNIELTSGHEYWTGSVFSLVNFDNSENAANVNIRYLISFDKDLPIESNETGYGAAQNTTDVSKIYSSYYKLDGSTHTFSTYMGKNVTYAPLTTTTEKINGETYIGIFNRNFEFRKAINGDSSVLKSDIASDKLLSDYFQFVVYNKVNDFILDKIGWRSMAYSNAATLFATNLSNVKVYYDTYKNINETQYNTDIENALNVGTWVINSEATLLQELVEKYVEEKNKEELVALLEYIFSERNMYSIVVTDDFRADIIKYLVEKDFSDIFDSSLINFTNGYAQVLAATLSNSTTNDVYQNLTLNLEDYISNVGGITKQNLLLAYASYLSSSSGDGFFNNTSNYARYDLLKNIFLNLDYSTTDGKNFYDTIYSVFSDANQKIIDKSNSNVSTYSAYSKLTDEEKIDLFKKIILNNDETVIENYLNACATDINLFAELNNKYSDYNISRFDDIFDDNGNASIKSSNTSTTDKVTIDNRISLWNKIKTIDTFKTYLTELIGSNAFIARATEHKNTWMSNTGEEASSGSIGINANYSAITEKEINANTIFFGPYVDQNKTLIDDKIYSGSSSKYYLSPTTEGMMKNKDQTSGMNNVSAKGYDLSAITNTIYGNQQKASTYLSVFMTTNRDLADKYKEDGKIYNYAVFGYSYGTTRYNGDSSSNEFCAFESLTETQIGEGNKAALQLKPGNADITIDGNNETLNLKQGAYITQYSGGKAIIFDGTNTNTYSFTTTQYKEFTSNYALKYYIALPTENFPSYRTGLYLYQQPWVVNYIMPGGGYTYTTHYIDYSVDDLLKVDGVCSAESNISTEYEREIINRIFEDYLLTDSNKTTFEKIVKKALFESLQKINDKDNISFVDTIISNAIGKEITLGSGTSQTTFEILSYLKYNSTSSTTVKDYLNSLTLTNPDLKEKILNAAASNKDVFCELLFLLFDTTLTSGADDSWEPGSNMNWGGSLDVTSIYQRIKYMGNASWTSVYITDKVDSGIYPMKNCAIPLVIDNKISEDYYKNNLTEKVNLNNIGYYTGSEAKLYSKDTINNVLSEDLEYNDKNLVKNVKIYTKTSSTSGSKNDIDISSKIDDEIKSAIINNLNYSDGTNGRRLYGIRLNQQISVNNQVKLSNITIANNTYSSTSYLPSNAVWFVPQKTGMVKIVCAVFNDGTQGFTLYKINRSSVKEDSDNAYSAKIESVDVISSVKSGDTDVFNDSWTRKMTQNRLYYYEIPVEANVEYALGQANSNGSYLIYLDLGQNGNVQQETANKTNYIQKQFDEYADNALNKLIPYVTPLFGGTNERGDYFIYAPATTYDSSTTYYERKGSGTSTDPYVYNAVTDQSTVTEDNVTKYYVYTGKNISDYQNFVFNDDFIKLLGKYSNEIIVNAIEKIQNDKNISDDKKKEILSELVGKSVDNSYLIFNAIISDYEKNADGTSKLTDDYKQWLVSGYLATDYYHNLNLNLGLEKTLLAKELPDLGSDCDYIDDNGNIIPANFENFKKKIGLNYQDDGYGIFALASGKGIQNGTFIPDNLDLTSMDTYYNLLDKDDNNAIIGLVDTKNDSWRGNQETKGSVEYAFKTEMKQLKLSISTTIFELDLNYSNDEVIYAGTNEITSNSITYYLPQGYIDNLISVGINYKRIADSATLTTNSNDNIDFTKLVKNSEGNYVLSDAVTVTAEDSSVVQKYDIIIVPTEVSFEISSCTTDFTNNKLNYNGGKVTLNITTTNMPSGFNFSKYLTITNGTNEDLSSYWEIDGSIDGNGVVVNSIDGNGEAKLVVDVFSSMPGGNLIFTLNAFSSTDSENVEKIKNSEALIKSFKFEGEDLINKFEDLKQVESTIKQVESTIKFGRAYNYNELISYNDSTLFYLYEFSYSDNASVNVTAEKNDYGSGRIQYDVTYEITSEDGNTTSTYKHLLTESDYFDENSVYANIYKDGISQNNDDLYKNAFVDDNVTLNDTNKSSIIYNNAHDNFIALAYNRGLSPEYRIKYNLANFYTLGGDTYSHDSNDLAKNTSITESYRGLTVSVSDAFSPGVYKYEYTYTRSGTWNDEEYKRTYTFPTIYIVKLLSNDSLLNRLTFIDSSIMLGNTATVMKPSNESSTSIVQDKSGQALDGNEVTYNSLFTSSNRDIEIKGRNISYNNNSDAATVSDYFAIGTVSDSDLSYYCPTFGIEEHAQIYQYTTLNKLKNYGENQTSSDFNILSDHSDRLLYVPFTSNNQIYVFLVLIDGNGMWKSVYDTNYDGKDENFKLYDYEDEFTTLDATTSEDSPANFDEYTIDLSAGKVNDNQSLYMDYIGNPCENHFWYVSYLVFSESALNGDFTEGNVRYYHISIIDATNTVYFDVELYAPESLNLSSLYLTISENIYNDLGVKTSSQQISGYLNKTEEMNENGLYKYVLSIKLQTLPKGYFYFYIDLPQGYSVSVTTDMINQLDITKEPGSNEKGSFLPFTSIVPKTIKLTFTVSEGNNAGNGSWGLTTTDIVTIKAQLEDTSSSKN